MLEGSERAAAELAAHCVGARDVTVNDAQQANGLALILELLVDTRVIAPKGAHADYGYVDDVIGVQTCVCRRLPIVPMNTGATISRFPAVSIYKRVFLRMAIWPA